jgi:hypothetical protein
VAQAVEHLLCKREDLISNPSPTKKKRKGEKERKEKVSSMTWGCN